MPSPAAESRHATHVEDLLHQRGASHLRARKYGSAVLVESEPASDPVKHFRLRRESSVLWRLDMATHTGRWEPTPFRGAIDDLVTTVADDFPWTLTPIA
jgi:hypothetical protein